MRKTHWLAIAALLLATPALAGGNHRAQRLRDYDDWYFNGKDWIMATTSWLGTNSDDASAAGNYSNGLPVTADDLLFPETAIRAMGSNMDAFAGVKSTGTLTLAANAIATKTVTIGLGGAAITYTWVAALGSADDVLIGGSASASIDNLVAAITGGAGEGSVYGTGTVAHTHVTAVRDGDTMDVTALLHGVDGDLLETTETMTNGSWGDVTLTGGADFLFNLIWIGRGHGFDIGDSANPLYTNATKLVHQGEGQLFYKKFPVSVTNQVIINSANNNAAATITGTDGTTPWDPVGITNLNATRGHVTIAGDVDVGQLFVGYLTNPTFDVTVVAAAEPVTVLIVYGGQYTGAFVPPAVHIYGGSIALTGTTGAGLIQMFQSGGRFQYDSTKTITAYYLLGGVADLTQATREVTISALYKAPDPIATLFKSDDLVTIVTTHDFTGGDTP